MYIFFVLDSMNREEKRFCWV